MIYLAKLCNDCIELIYKFKKKDPVGHQEMRDRLAATIVRYNALMGVHAATHQRADTMEYAKSRELKRARKRRSHRAVAEEGDAGHGIGV